MALSGDVELADVGAVAGDAPTELPSLESIELLARHRELTGYHLLNELRDLLMRLMDGSVQRVALDGPDTLFISQYQPAVDFLVESLGFVVEELPSAPLGQSGTGKPPAPDARSRPPSKIVGPRVAVSPGSSDFILLQRRIATALENVEWARWVNTSLIRVRLHSVHLVKVKPTDEIGLSLTVAWTDVLGKPRTEVFPVNDRYYVGPNQLRLAHESVMTQAASACSLTATVVKRGTFFDKQLGSCSVTYPNLGMTRCAVDIRPTQDAAPATTPSSASSPSGNGGGPLPVGHLIMEVDSIAHRFRTLQSATGGGGDSHHDDAVASATAVAPSSPSGTTTAAPSGQHLSEAPTADDVTPPGRGGSCASSSAAGDTVPRPVGAAEDDYL